MGWITGPAALSRLLLAATLAALAAAPLSAQDAITVSALVDGADRYDGEVVRVVGLVAAYRERLSRSGEPYTAFDLRDGKASVAVFAWPHQGLRNGLKVRVTGTFFRLKTYGFIKAQRAVVVR